MPIPKSNKVELLAPAGNFEKLEIAIHYGADAVYLGGKDFSLRNFSGNFSLEEIKQAVTYAHDRAVKVYAAVNVYARNDQHQQIAAYLRKLGAISLDGVIVADPGVFMTARELMPHIPLHLSTQANSTNYKTVAFWERLGIQRINLARELTLAEIKAIAEKAQIEIEAFVHGAMCIAYSGRCLLSSFMANRHSNRGMCTHPCRWKYALVEETRPGQYMPVAEDDRGTYIFNSKDLCMIEHIPAMIDAGVAALKIEGRMKGINYLASVLKVYREAIDWYSRDPAGYRVKPE
ncbi:MAG: peptidase U32 family protein, partial [Desulfobacterales bacterium]